MLFPTLDPTTLQQIFHAALSNNGHVAMTFLDPDVDENGAEACRRMTLHATVNGASWRHDRYLHRCGVEVSTNLSDLRIPKGDQPKEAHLLQAASTASFLEELRDAFSTHQYGLVHLDGGVAVFASDGASAERLMGWLREQGASARPAA